MTYTITGLANEFGVTHRTLRFYEEKGLLEPARIGQTRLYSRRDRARLQLILRGRDMGLTLYEIRQILELYQNGNCEEQYRLAISLFRKRIVAAQEMRDKVTAQLVRLEEACDRLNTEMTESLMARDQSAPLLRTGTD